MRTANQLSGAGAQVQRRLIDLLEAGGVELPMLPDTASRVIDGCNDDESSAIHLAELIEHDPSLAGHVLRVANSAAFAPEEPIVTLQHAVSRLGMDSLCGIAVSIAVKGRVFHVPGYEAVLARTWTHSVLAGAWAKEIARARRRAVDGAFLCGLLHDVGRPVLLQTTLDLASELGVDVTPEDVSSLCNLLHAEVGADLLKRWGLPEWMVAATRGHHLESGPGDVSEVACTAYLADKLAHLLDANDVGTARAELERDPVLGALDLFADELGELLQYEDRVRETGQALS